MSFGWSAGDIVAGVKIVWDIWNSVSDGPLNAIYEATQFFNDFEIIKGCLESWDSRDQASSGKPSLTEPLRRQCAKFIEEHMRLIQDANIGTKVVQNGGRTWLRKVPFTKQQVLKLYQQVQWPFVRGNVAELRSSLELALGVATYRVAENTHELVQRLSISVYVTLFIHYICTDPCIETSIEKKSDKPNSIGFQHITKFPIHITALPTLSHAT
jgi:hypothetical protein